MPGRHYTRGQYQASFFSVQVADRFSNAYLHFIMSCVLLGVGSQFLVCKVDSCADRTGGD